MEKTIRAGALSALVLLGGCAANIDDGIGISAEALTSAETTGVLDLLNDTATTRNVLDYDCGFYSNAARQTIKHRDGRDRVYPSADDDLFDTVEEFEGVSGVGPAHVRYAVDCARARGYVSAPLCPDLWQDCIEWYAICTFERPDWQICVSESSWEEYDADPPSFCENVGISCLT